MTAPDRRGGGEGGGVDHVVVALTSLMAGAGAGATLIAAGVLVFRTFGPPRPMLDVTVLAAIAAAASTAWQLGDPLPDGWRRGLTAALAAFGGLLLGALTAPAHLVAGSAGVFALGALTAGFGLWAGRAARRAADA